MNKVKIITDSCCSLTPEKLNALDIDYVQMNFTVNGETYNTFEHPTKDKQKFYDALSKAKSCSTSCVNNYAFAEIFEKYVKLGYDIVYIGLSGGLSATFNNAIIAADEINSFFGKHVWVANSLTGSFGIAIMLEEATRMIKEEKSAEEIFNAINNNKMNLYTIFIPSDLSFLHRSGRISKFASSIGTMLKITPIIIASEQGELKMIAKCLGPKKATKFIQKFILENADLESEEKIYIGHTGITEEAEEFANFLKENTKNKTIEIDFIDYTMGCNCGPYTLALFGRKK